MVQKEAYTFPHALIWYGEEQRHFYCLVWLSGRLQLRFIKQIPCTKLIKRVRLTWTFLYCLSKSGIVPRDFSCSVFDPIVHRFLVGFIPAAAAEGYIVNLLVTIERNRHCDNGHKSLRFHQVFVWPWTTTDRQNLGYYLAIVELMPPPQTIVPLITVSPGKTQDTWWFRQLEDLAKAPRIFLWLCVGGEESVCFVTCDWEDLWPLGETQVADMATVYQIELPKRLQVEHWVVQSIPYSVAVKRVRLDADNGADNIKAMLGDCSVPLADWVDKLYCITAETAETSGGRNVQLQQNLNDHFYGEFIELTSSKTGGGGHKNVSTIVERAAFFESRIVWDQGCVLHRCCAKLNESFIETFWDQAEAKISTYDGT